MFKKKYDIGIIGSICSVDFNTAKSLSELGVKVVVFQKDSSRASDVVDRYYDENELGFEIYTYDSPMDFFEEPVHAGSFSVLPVLSLGR